MIFTIVGKSSEGVVITIILITIGFLIIKAFNPSYIIEYNRFTKQIITTRLKEVSYIEIDDVTNMYEDFLFFTNHTPGFDYRKKYILRAKNEQGRISTYKFYILSNQTELSHNYLRLRYTVLLARKERLNTKIN